MKPFTFTVNKVKTQLTLTSTQLENQSSTAQKTVKQGFYWPLEVIYGFQKSITQAVELVN